MSRLIVCLAVTLALAAVSSAEAASGKCEDFDGLVQVQGFVQGVPGDKMSAIMKCGGVVVGSCFVGVEKGYTKADCKSEKFKPKPGSMECLVQANSNNSKGSHLNAMCGK